MDQARAQQDFDIDFEDVFYTAPAFCDNANAPVVHAFFGRRGGVSTGIYDSLNCGPGSDDQPDHVRDNLNFIARMMGLKTADILTLYQVHGRTCLRVEAPWRLDSRPQADAMVTDRPGLALGVLTADCAPVLFRGETREGRPVVAAAHAGWKGAMGGILQETVARMEDYGVRREDIRAAVGPCIGQFSYEVSEEFYRRFLDEAPANSRFFHMSRRPEHFMFDLAAYCAHKLAQEGVHQVAVKGLDTCFNEEDFFSYRRATHRGEKDYGRQISLIYIKPD